MTRIYTRRGDAGLTGLFDGSRVSKASPRVAATGEVDELNAWLGLVRARLGGTRLGDLDTELARVQRDLFALGALLADPRRDGSSPEQPDADRLALGATHVERMEQRIDAWEAELPPLRAFILPAGTEAAAALHVSRTVARRAERAVTAQVEAGVGHPLAVAYLNRLGDMLFVAARLANHRAGGTDEPW